MLKRPLPGFQPSRTARSQSLAYSLACPTITRKPLSFMFRAWAGVPGASTARGKSSCPAERTKLRSPWLVRVGSPVLGPGRCASTMTREVSVQEASPRVSTIRAKPPPEEPVMARTPA